MKRIVIWAGSLAVLFGCAGKPPTPDWQLEGHGAAERAVAAYLEGNARVERAEFERARGAVAATGRVELVARIELRRCATRVASLVFEPCAGFDALRPDAAAPERAYADYLAGTLAAQDVALLPATQRAAAGGTGAAAVAGIVDPLGRLVAAGVLLRGGRATPELLQLAVDTASAQGWRRPLLAWLGVQAERAERAGARAEAERLRRRMAIVGTER